MKVYILVRNEFCVHEYDNYFNEAVYLDEAKATEACEFSNKNRGSDGIYSGVSFSIEEYTVQE